jgi:uncharacterized repeat protein (TIGR01451 family)
MIQVCVTPAALPAGQRCVLTIKLANTGQDTYSAVVFRLKLPPGMALVSGPDKIVVDEIQARQVHVHQVTVLPRRPGDAELSTPNFSYRDEDGVTRRQDDWRTPIRVLAALPSPPKPAQAGPVQVGQATSPRLTLSHSGGKLALGNWGDLEISIHNPTGTSVHDVLLTVAGPFQVDHPSARIDHLRDGATDRAAISVQIPDRGQIPVRIRTTYRYWDERGQLVPSEQNDRLTVEATAPVEPDPVPVGKASATTILFLVAQPRNTDPLRSYAEMREVETLRRLGRDQSRYQLEGHVATRLRDISQALGDYKPQIVHFAGHGGNDGTLVVEDDFGRASLVNPDGLANLLGGFASIQCVLVNACHSLVLAKALHEKIHYVVGMGSEIRDAVSIQFSIGFYQGLFAGKTVPDAFRQGRDLVQAEPKTNSSYQIPILLVRET